MGNPGEIFILDMGKPVRIVDLARDMIRLSGFTQDEIKIEFSGLRPGEKLFEELLADGEQTKETSHKKLRIALTKTVDIKWTNSMLKWIFTIPDKDERLIKKELKTWVKEYQGNINAN
jgi:FlaA1/EpsC-like NDP-sugar epimerase